jgi:uracil-DNA glycosylase
VKALVGICLRGTFISPELHPQRLLMNLEVADAPNSLAWDSERRRRQRLLHQPHMHRLTEFVMEMREVEGLGAAVPFFDPLDGGALARCLCVLDSPTTIAVSSGFVSRSNGDAISREAFQLFREAGIQRSETVLWNVIPWCREGPSSSDGRLPPAGTLKYLLDLLDLLPRLEIVILGGRIARKTEPFVRARRPRVEVLRTSLAPQRDEEKRAPVLAVLRKAAAYLDSTDGEGAMLMESALRR